MASLRVKIDLPQNYFAIRSVCERLWQIILTGSSAESITVTAVSRVNRECWGNRAEQCWLGSELR